MIGKADKHPTDKSTIAVDITNVDRHGLLKHQCRSELLGALAEVLAILRAVDAFESNADGVTVAHDRDRVPIGNANHSPGEDLGGNQRDGKPRNNTDDREGR